MRDSVLCASLVTVAGFAGPAALGQQAGSACMAVTDGWGARIVRSVGVPGGEEAFSQRDLLWQYANDFAAIPQSVALSPTLGLLWAGEALNGERIQSFAVPGDGVPLQEYAVSVDSAAAVAASAGTGRVAFIDGPEGYGPYSVRGLDPAAGPTWTFDIPAPYLIGYASKQIKVSRDGSTVAVGCSFYDSNTQESGARVYILDAATGVQRSMWQGTGGVTAVDLSDNGSRCLVTNDQAGRLLETAGGTQVFSASASGAGGWFVVSGNGNTVVVGGFNVAVWVYNGTSWARRILFQGANQWYGWGLGVSRDGNTVAALSHDYANGYLDTYTRVWDVPSRTLLGTYHTVGSGGLQDSAQGCHVSDDGSLIAVCSWGAEDNNHPEVMIFDRTAHFLGGIDTPGSVFALAGTPDGRYTASGSKAVHANMFGNGGHVSLFDYRPCLADFNGDDFVDFFDYSDYVGCFETGQCPAGRSADFNRDNFVDFFDYVDFVDAFEAGC
jgi:hypothetical protein